jgi:hypothetical protein
MIKNIERKNDELINKKIKTQNAEQEPFNSPNKKLSKSSSMHIVYVNLSLNSTQADQNTSSLKQVLSK